MIIFTIFFFKTRNFSFVHISTHAAPTAKSIQRTSYMLNGLWFEYRQGQESFLLSTEPRALLKLKHIPIQWLSEFVAGIKLPDHSLSSGGEVKSERSQTATPPTCLHGVCRGNFVFFNWIHRPMAFHKLNVLEYLRFTYSLQRAVVWDVTTCSLVETCQLFGGSSCFHL